MTLLPNFDLPDIELVVFDLFGTLARYSVRRQPFVEILRFARAQGRTPKQDDARVLMTSTGSTEEIFAKLGIYPSPNQISEFHERIKLELEGLSLFNDVEEVLIRLASTGKKVAVCSNLAQPYGAALSRLLPDLEALICFSYQVGFVKPEVKIYDWIEVHSGVNRRNTLFIGDTYEADYRGPKDYGFRALHLRRAGQSLPHQISSLSQIFEFMQ